MPATAQLPFSTCTIPIQGVVPLTVGVSSHLNLTQARPTSLQTCLEARLSHDSRHAKTTINYNHHLDFVSDPKDSMKLPFFFFSPNKVRNEGDGPMHRPIIHLSCR